MALTDKQKMEIVATLKKLHPKHSQSTEYPKEPITSMMLDAEIPTYNAPQVVTPKPGTTKTGITQVTSPQDALPIVSSLSDYAQEQNE